jgi:UDP-2,3-diacylglucosamine pyrophosphatase LpxH
VSAPLLVLSDLHLSHGASEDTARAFAELIGQYPGHEIVLGGDVFGLSSDPRSRDPRESVGSLLAAEPALISALRQHLARGFALTLIAGNHDAALTIPGMRAALLSQLELTDAAALAIEPWFIRRGGVHVEHGHLWDPDNAPAHPLAPWSPRTEPLGIQLTRRFVARNGVWEFAHAHETTLVAGLQRAFKLFGARAPALVVSYFATSSTICAETLLDRGLGRDVLSGEQALLRQAATADVGVDSLQALLERAPRPTHLTFRDTFLRLYFDRVLSALGVGAGALLLLTRRSPAGIALAIGSGAYWSLNVRQSGSRYRNQPVVRLRDGASTVAQVTGADLVVFGHTHVPEVDRHYANAGSFGYPARGMGRPYLLLAPNGTAELRRHG